MDSEYTKPGILDNIWKILPDWKLFKGSSSYEHFSDEEDNDDNEENIIKTKTRARRAGFSAVHFQKEKIQKQIIAAMKRRDSTQLENTINGIDLCEIEERGEDWLFLKKACDMDATDLTAVLLRHNADINFFGCGSCVPLHIASKKGNLPMCALLLSKGAKINLLTKYEFKSALHLATLEGHDAVAKLLLENEADVNIRDIYGETPLQIASRLGRKNIVELFLTYHASINEYNLDGWTGLHLASESGNVAIVSVLLDHKANIDCQTKYGRTSLSWACASNQLNVVDELLKRGADANILDLHNKKAYQHARNTAIKSLVLKHTEKEDPLGEKFVSTIGLFIEIDPRRDSLYPKKQKQIAQVLNLWKPISHENNTSHESKNCNPSHRMSLQTTEDGSPNPSSSALMVKDQVQASFSNLNVNTTIQLDSLETNLERLVRDISISQHQTGSNGNDLLIVVDELVENVNHLRGSFTREMKALLQAYAETKDDAAHRRTGSLSYIALLQMFRQSVIDYISSKPSGWEEFLKNLSIPSELRDILTVKLKVGSLNERAKIEYLLSYWAKHNDEFAKEPGHRQFYMKIICEDIKKCEFEDERGQTSEVIKDLLKLSLDLKGGYSYDSSAKINVLLSNLSAKEINTLLNEITSQALDTNMFPELGDILEDITGVVKTDEPPEQNNIPDSSSEKLKELLCQAIETEDIEKLAVIVRDLILSEHEDLLIFIL